MWIISALLLLASAGDTSKVSVGLEAGWKSPPIYVEAVEFIATLGDTHLLLKFINAVGVVPDLDQKSDIELAPIVSSIANDMNVSKANIRMMNFALSLHVYSPKIEASRTMWLQAPSDCAQVFFSSKQSTFCELSSDVVHNANSIPAETDLIILPGDRVVIIHGILEAKGFYNKLQAAIVFCRANKFGLSLRWQFSNEIASTPTLTGYGVELRLKSTEYKASDDAKTKDDDEELIKSAAGFHFDTLTERFPDLQKAIKKFAKYVSDSSQEIQPMKKWQWGDLSLQAGQTTSNRFLSDGADAALETLNTLTGNFPQHAMRLARTPVSAPFKKELRLNAEVLGQTLGLRPGSSHFAINGMSVDLTSQWGDPFQLLDSVRSELSTMENLAKLGIAGKLAQEVLQAPVPQDDADPVLLIPGNDDGCVWLNDIEKDKKYAQHSTNLQDFLRPTFPGVLRRLRFNYLNLLIFIDPLSSDLFAVHDVIDTIDQNNLPVRIGIIFTGASDEAKEASAIFHYLLRHNKEKKKSKMFTWRKWFDLREENFDPSGLSKAASTDWENVKSPGSQSMTSAEQMTNYGNTIGIGSSSTILINGDAMKNLDFSSGMEETVYELLLEVVQPIQRAIYYGQYRPDQTFVEYFNQRPGVVTRFNKDILTAPKEQIDLSQFDHNGKYFGDGRATTFWVVTDVDKEDGKRLVKEALEHHKTASNSRLSIIHCGKPSELFTSLRDASTIEALELLNSLGKNEIKEESGSICDRLDLDTVYVNGAVFKKTANFIAADFGLLETLSSQGGAGVVASLLKDFKPDDVMKAINALNSQKEIKARQSIEFPSSKHTVLEFEPTKEGEAAFDVVAIFDPASEDAQKMVPIISTLRHVINMRLRIFLNCQENLVELPVKSFYRFVITSQPTAPDKTRALFKSLPHHSLLTAAVIPPESWIVAAVDAVHDLDNIKLVEQGDVNAIFMLQHILLEGQAYDTSTGSPPRGTQFELAMPNRSDHTSVMANLGYFQLKASPGYWNLNLREGLSSDIYEIKDISGSDDHAITMTSFTPKSIRVGVSKRAGMEQMDVLGKPDDLPKVHDDDSSIWDRVGEAVGLKAKKEKPGNKVETTEVINIFSLASGHMYERLMRIMMLSVIRKTETKVKFWILENYASPAFRQSLPILAKEYGFKYEFVQYKWPRWLNAQKEKQRTMWGYKILFLDVLFPLNIDKIIFVDADQIIRADLKELAELDLEGNPYGYTPFCDDRQEMDGFRFWNGGYWKQHLAGRKYHISAIYVVDLKRFRELAAGDRLRGQYQGLSQDPNSLANLDQDLPNNMIHQVGIKSLPQEWLWCATWCSDESKEKAKTIDLCNNPLTKEPKLTAAARIVPEWTGYDVEIKKVLGEQVAEEATPNHTEL